MIEYALWFALGLMALSAVIPSSRFFRKPIGALGWVFFGIHWAYQPIHYLEIHDYFNVILTILVAIFCFFLAYTMVDEYRRRDFTLESIDVTSMVTGVAAIGSLFYFPFLQMESLNHWIISTVTSNTVFTLQTLGYSVTSTWNTISLYGYTVEIILACTAIESIALFMGLITSVKAPMKKVVSAFMVSVPVIYFLNVLRDAFVIVAYAEQWFGVSSFEIAHHGIAKFGSLIALFVIGYAVLKILPELFDLIDGVFELVTTWMRSVTEKLSGIR
ncbi:archaeosortase A (PGF-CTERM-specific) [Methanohalophilus levihalophilus]|uniref:archaeosortase A n=1 Tax=Methanohalophilus levihalophilus TaxID=1431282 RepID=UPI001AE2845D|nr:archaeosortase A [Methanohalophilus levihalophilus]MBP2030270.1 archaeosortase A (PGF-CTERM-specific) [Methanohalophilus levihalophilus]